MEIAFVQSWLLGRLVDWNATVNCSSHLRPYSMFPPFTWQVTSIQWWRSPISLNLDKVRDRVQLQIRTSLCKHVIKSNSITFSLNLCFFEFKKIMAQWLSKDDLIKDIEYRIKARWLKHRLNLKYFILKRLKEKL